MTEPLLTLPQLLASGVGVLVIMGVSSWLLLREDKAAKQLGSRLDSVATSYARVNPLQRAGRPREKAQSGLARTAGALGKVFGYDLGRSVYYPVKIPVLILLTLLLTAGMSHLVTTVVGQVGYVLFPFIWLFASRKGFSSFEQRRANKLYNQFPDALAMIVRSVRVGIPVSEAVRNVSKECLEPTATEFTILSDQLAIGVPLEEALRDCAARNQLSEYRFFATALSLQAQTGGGLSETLENLAEVIRKRVAARNRAYAMASEARTTMYILAGLPVATGLVLLLFSPDYILLLFTETKGNVVLAAALMMLGTGMFAMKTIITKTLK